MNSRSQFNTGRIRIIVFAAVAIIHILLILFVAVKIETVVALPEPVAGVMKLMDLQEKSLPPEKAPEAPPTETQPALAETVIETLETPPPLLPVVTGPVQDRVEEQIDYLPQYKVSVLAVLPEDQIRRATVYPPIALRSGIEGTVYLDLFIDAHGLVRDVQVLRENPPGRGFGEAAVNAFKGIRAIPAEANGMPVAMRLRYNITFTLK